jgi:signal peptidase I
MGKANKQNSSGFWTSLKKFWSFIWNDDSILSWVLSIVIAFIIIKFLMYPAIGFALNTDYPIVAVVSGSMEHKFAVSDAPTPTLCGNFGAARNVNFNDYWQYCGKWYEGINITKEKFNDFSYLNGFNTGDIIILRNPGVSNIKVGDVIVFIQPQNPVLEPIIHRVVKVSEVDGKPVFQTKGDHNTNSIFVDAKTKYLNEYNVTSNQVIGRATFRIPYLGYVKIYAYQLLIKVRNLF